MAQVGHSIASAKNHLEAGRLVAIPTETVYGLAANALDERAVLSIFKSKNRPAFDPLIVHTHHLDEISNFAHLPTKWIKKLANAFWPGPLTLLFPKKQIIPDLVTSGLDTVAVRIPNHPLTLSLLEQLDFPLAAPSANPFGYVSPTTAQHVKNQLDDQVDYILDGGRCGVGLESTILSLVEGSPKVLRLGGLSIESIEAVIGRVDVAPHSSSAPLAPGMLKSHYAPKKSIVRIDEVNIKEIDDFSEIGAVVFQYTRKELLEQNQIVLSPSGDLDAAAKEFFAAFRTMDERKDINTIWVENAPNHGLGRAINDRIKRATAKE